MKHLKLLCLITSFIIVGCVSSQEKDMRRMINNMYSIQGFTGFKEYNHCTLADEVDEQIKIYNCKITWDKSFYDAFRGNYYHEFETTLPKDYIYTKYLFYKDEISKDETAIKYLESIKDTYSDIYYQKSFIIYRLTYWGTNDSGEMINDSCYGKFDKENNLVAFKQTNTSHWEIIGDECSIPDYDYYITSPF